MFKLTMETSNAAFGPGDGDDAAYERDLEVARILKAVSDSLCRGATSGRCMDYNGNAVGTWELTES